MSARSFLLALRPLCDRRLWMLVLSMLLASGSQTEAAEKSNGPEFVRVKKNDSGQPAALQTAIAHYQAKDGSKLKVDLIGAVHVGEDSYYKELNKRFKAYDAVMYELVAPEGTRVPAGGAGHSSPVSGLQNGMKDMLELEFQLEKVDYSPENFIHADMSPEEFAKDMEERGDSILGMFARAMGQGLVQQSKGGSTDAAIMMALFSSDRAKKLRRVFASQISDMDSQMRAIEGKNGSTIISQRNAKAFEVMGREIKNGKEKIAVFYGAGHLEDMHKRLLDDFGMELKSVEYLDAWDLD
ncbi:hypothetical protein DTL21_12395 [Bremerella cremea]|uniref:TraB/GumN family protein n=1 Tax=Blastopirellula marina TaxID=124 RepID=A0A2S8FR51_9BACT|nr:MULTISPECIES: hypothetical protein [Pirellulaceae]PQO34324.1 hypothetical protein C5Y83_12390 [Blastopirellula marina]RCS46820.1 hypothetical protein DTL21_12395 [Bremerella cremea]